MGVSPNSRCTTHSFQPTSHTLGVTGRGGDAPARCPQGRAPRSGLGGPGSPSRSLRRPSSRPPPAPFPLASFAAHPRAHVGANPLLPHQLLAGGGTRTRRPPSISSESQDTAAARGPTGVHSYCPSARPRHLWAPCSHPKENQGTVTKAAAEQTGIDGADPVA
jgi:hypothetical protein